MTSLVSAAREQSGRHRGVSALLVGEAAQGRHVATLVRAVTEELHGAVQASDARVQSWLQLASSSSSASNASVVYAQQRQRAVTLALHDSDARSNAAAVPMDALVAEAAAGRDARERARETMRKAAQQQQSAFGTVHGMLFPRAAATDDGGDGGAGATAVWRDARVAAAGERARALLQRAGETLARVERARTDTEAEWRRRAADVVSVERNMMQLFWEDPATTARLNAALAKLSPPMK